MLYAYTVLVTGYNKHKSLQEENLFSLYGQVVLDLCKTIPEETDLAFDNYFSSINLMVRLKEKNIQATSTLRIARRGKKDNEAPLMTETELKECGRGSFDYPLNEEGILIVSWLATNHNSVHNAEVLMMFNDGITWKIVYKYSRSSYCFSL